MAEPSLLATQISTALDLARLAVPQPYRDIAASIADPSDLKMLRDFERRDALAGKPHNSREALLDELGRSVEGVMAVRTLAAWDAAPYEKAAAVSVLSELFGAASAAGLLKDAHKSGVLPLTRLIESLGLLRHDSTLPMLQRSLLSRNPFVRERSAIALGMYEGRAAGAAGKLLELATSGYEPVKVRGAAFWALGEIVPVSGDEMLSAVVLSVMRTELRRATELIKKGEINGTRVAEFLAHALGRFGERAGVAAVDLISLIGVSDTGAACSAAVIALSQIGAPAVPVLIAGIANPPTDSGNKEFWAKLSMALGGIGLPAIAPILAVLPKAEGRVALELVEALDVAVRQPNTVFLGSSNDPTVSNQERELRAMREQEARTNRINAAVDGYAQLLNYLKPGACGLSGEDSSNLMWATVNLMAEFGERARSACPALIACMRDVEPQFVPNLARVVLKISPSSELTADERHDLAHALLERLIFNYSIPRSGVVSDLTIARREARDLLAQILWPGS